jgi:hypothetical protein
MRGGRRHHVSAILAILTMFAARAHAASSPALDKAVAELKKEYAANAKDPAGKPLRKSCKFFDKSAASGIPADALLQVLEKPLSGADARQTAYIKWQLLSALPASLDDATVKRLVKVYDRAPTPAARYGISAREQKELDKLIPGARPQDDVKLNDKLNAAADRGFGQDMPVIAFRDELYKRLPAGREKFVAALHDAATRINAAAPKDTLAESLETDIPAWAIKVPDADRDQVREVAELLGKLRFVESPPYYAYASVRSGKLGWRTHTDSLLTPKKFSTLHKTLLDLSGDAKPQAAAAAGAPKKAGNRP